MRWWFPEPGGSRGNNCLMGTEFQFGKVLEMVGDGGHTTM